MDLLQWVALWSLIGTQIGTAIGIYRYFDHRINGVYKRLDDVKEHINSKFVLKDTCGILHQNTAINLVETETRLNDRFDKLEVKVESLFNRILDIIKK